MLIVNENIYGHKSRVDWFKKFITKEQKGLEFGCGTGVMITALLLQSGYDIEGIDLDEESINMGKKIFKEHNLDPTRLICNDLNNIENCYDYIIASEVLEHIPNNELNAVLNLLIDKIKPNGLLLISVPNGYGWFELEDFIWKKLKINSVFRFFKLYYFIEKIKKYFIGYHYLDCKYPSSVADSPHLQRFTLNSICDSFESLGIKKLEARGSSLLSGPFLNIFFTGFKPIMQWNIKMAEKLPSISSGFYIAFKKR